MSNLARAALGLGLLVALVAAVVFITLSAMTSASQQQAKQAAAVPQKDGGVPTPVPTFVPAATPVPQVPPPAAGCPTTAETQLKVGQSVVREGVEPCAWEWRSFPAVVTADLPAGYIGTLHLSDDRIIVTDVAGTYQVKAGTWRFRAAYPLGDPARDNNCGLLAKEQEFGRKEVPSFNVGPLGFTCP